ncbi:hypothetical protein Syun_030080 [Stephania yunnanensis]|uniref:Uncharacterized protein n=1 Tax=Stephania yunnanensis TaxID=152371 RepID=A0AAP0E6V3_9MAGN
MGVLLQFTSHLKHLQFRQGLQWLRRHRLRLNSYFLHLRHYDMLSMPTDRGVRVMAKARQSREFQRHQPKKFHGGTDLIVAKMHDVLATLDHMRSSISSALSFGEADVWLRTTVASMGTLKDWAKFKASESVGAHAPEYRSHHRHRQSRCKGLEVIGGRRELDDRG